jgi:protein-L-isoaspartate(D-aspartate) O-methyltransferase
LNVSHRPTTSTELFGPERRAMIDHQLRRRGIRDARVLEAMFEVPRHEFVPAMFREAAYDDRPIVIGDGQTISQPYIVAEMTEAAGIAPGDKVLEVGAGSGYQAAVLAHLGARVVTLERNPWLAATARERLGRLGYSSVQVIAKDGSEGHPPAAPYAAILVTAAAPRVPQMLLEQLADEGRLVIPVGTLYQQTLQLFQKHGNEFSVSDLDACQFVPLIGKQAWPEKMG